MLDHYIIKSLDLAEEGQRILNRIILHMPILELLTLRFQNIRPFDGLKIAMCMHITAETAVLAIALKAGGANVYMAASNPKSIQDAAAAALVKYYGIHVFADSGETPEEYISYMDILLQEKPHIIIDDGATILPRAYERYPDVVRNLIGSTEQTTAGVVKVAELDKNKKLLHPAIAVNSSRSKYMYDNRFGVGQSFVDAFMRTTDMMLCGKTVVVCGYGYCGMGIAERARGMGANVIVTEVDTFKVMDAVLSGYRVMPLVRAAEYGDIFVSVTGNINIIDYDAISRMKPGVILANCGSGISEINVTALKEHTLHIRNIRPHLDEYSLDNGNHILLMAGGRVVNLVCAKGIPAEIMDMSFSVQAFGVEYLVNNRHKLENHMIKIPFELDQQIVRLKLNSMGISFDKQTEEQKNYAERFEATH